MWTQIIVTLHWSREVRRACMECHTQAESLFVFKACVRFDWWYNKQQSKWRNRTMLQLGEYHPQYGNRVLLTALKGKNKTEASPFIPSLCHLFSVSVALSWLNGNRRDRPRSRAPALSPSVIPPAQPPRMGCRRAPVCGDSFHLGHTVCTRGLMCSHSWPCWASVVLFRDNNSSLGMDGISLAFINDYSVNRLVDQNELATTLSNPVILMNWFHKKNRQTISRFTSLHVVFRLVAKS